MTDEPTNNLPGVVPGHSDASSVDGLVPKSAAVLSQDGAAVAEEQKPYDPTTLMTTGKTWPTNQDSAFGQSALSRNREMFAQLKSQVKDQRRAFKTANSGWRRAEPIPGDHLPIGRQPQFYARNRTSHTVQD